MSDLAPEAPPELADGVWLLGASCDWLELSFTIETSGRYGDGADDLERAILHHKPPRDGRERSAPTNWSWAPGAVEHPVLALRSMIRSAHPLQTDDFLLLVAPDGAPGPRLILQFRARYLHAVGPAIAYREGVAWIEREILPLVGRRILDEPPRVRIMRIDLAADVASPGLLSEQDLARFRTRAKAKGTTAEIVGSSIDGPREERTHHYGRKLKGLTFGRRTGLHARIYRKDLQLKDTGTDDWIRAHWEAAGYVPSRHGEDVTRVEFELHSDELRSMEVDRRRIANDPLELLERHQGDIWRYLTSKWLVLTVQDEDQPSRRVTDLWWRELSRIDVFDPDAQRSRIALRAADKREVNPHRQLELVAKHLGAYAHEQGMSSLLPALLDFQRFLADGWGYQGFTALAAGTVTIEQLKEAARTGQLARLVERALPPAAEGADSCTTT